MLAYKYDKHLEFPILCMQDFNSEIDTTEKIKEYKNIKIRTPMIIRTPPPSSTLPNTWKEVIYIYVYLSIYVSMYTVYQQV